MPLISSVLNEGKLYHVCSEEIEVKNLQTILTRGELEKEKVSYLLNLRHAFWHKLLV